MLDVYDIRWEKPVPAAERALVAGALLSPGLVQDTLNCLFGDCVGPMHPQQLTVRYLAMGGAKRVYRVQVDAPSSQPLRFVLKQFLPRQLAYLPPGATVAGVRAGAADLDRRLLERMVWAARRVDALAPGLCPRFGGFWEWGGEDGQPHRCMTEAYVEGESLDAWKAALEDRFIRREVDFAQYTAARHTLERQAIAAYVRLWDVLGRETFTSDPSPWNVLFVPGPGGYQPSLIDLHSIHDGGTPLYVFQTLEELFGSRDEQREQVLCPGILDALGEAEGARFLRTVGAEIEAHADARLRTGLSSHAASSRAIARFLAR